MEPIRKLALQTSLAEKWACLRPQAERNSAAIRGRCKRRIATAIAVLLCAIAMIVGSSEALFAQTPAASPAPAPVPPAEPDGITSGGYQIHSSVELGYRS